MDAEYLHQPQLSRDRMRALTRREDGPALRRVLVHWLLFALSLGLAMLAWDAGLALTLAALLLAGAFTVPMFAMLHECAHNTAFASRGANLAVSWVASILHLYTPTGFREFHFQHHRHTHEPGLDPEISVFGRPAPPFHKSIPTYLSYLTGLPLLLAKVLLLVTAALGPALPSWKMFYGYVPARHARALAWEGRLMVVIHGGLMVVAVLWAPMIWAFYLAQVVAHALLSGYLLVEHTGLPHDGSIIARTRHIEVPALVRYFMWNMPYHAEHHAYPGVPFHQLPALSAEMEGLKREGVLEWHRATLDGMGK